MTEPPQESNIFAEVLTTPDYHEVFDSENDRNPKVPRQIAIKSEDLDLERQVKCESEVSAAQPVSTERLKCTECNRYSALNEEQLLRHVRKVHRGQNPFQCYMCDYSTYNKPLFEEHVRIHKGIKPFKCTYCTYRSASKKNAKKHELIHRPNNPLKCPSCPFIARHVRSLNCHSRSHRGETKDRSGVRQSETEDRSSVRQSETERGWAEFVCDHCGTDFALASNLASHQRNVKKCDECDAVLCSKYLYNKHMLTEHAKYTSSESSFHCALCPFRSGNKTRTLLHLVHHPQPVPSGLDVSVLIKFGIMQ